MSNDTYFQPGAVVNGHYLASDNNWYPVQPQPVVVVKQSGGVSAALWIIVAVLTFPIWVWFTPLILVGLVIWAFVLMLQAVNARWGVKGVIVVVVSVWALIVAGLLAVAAA